MNNVKGIVNIGFIFDSTTHSQSLASLGSEHVVRFVCQNRPHRPAPPEPVSAVGKVLPRLGRRAHSTSTLHSTFEQD